MKTQILLLALSATFVVAQSNNEKQIAPVIPKTVYTGYTDVQSRGPSKMSSRFYKTPIQFIEDLKKAKYLGSASSLKNHPIPYGNDTFYQEWYITIDKSHFMEVYIGQQEKSKKVYCRVEYFDNLQEGSKRSGYYYYQLR